MYPRQSWAINHTNVTLYMLQLEFFRRGLSEESSHLFGAKLIRVHGRACMCAFVNIYICLYTHKYGENFISPHQPIGIFL